MAALRLLAVAINSKRLGCVVFDDLELRDWRSMTKATRSRSEAAATMQQLINGYRPNVVVTEKFSGRQSDSKVMQLQAALSRCAAQNYVLDVSVSRDRNFANKYEEAEAFADLYPPLQQYVPPVRKAFGHEPARLILFDAVALAQKVLQHPTQHLAEAMG